MLLLNHHLLFSKYLLCRSEVNAISGSGNTLCSVSSDQNLIVWDIKVLFICSLCLFPLAKSL